MADIFSPISATPQIFTSKSRPPFPQPMGMNVLGRHNQLPTPAVPVAQPLKVTQKRRHADDSDDDMERRSQSPSPEKRVLAPSRSRKLAPKRARVDADNGDLDSKETSKNSEAEVDVADARVLLGEPHHTACLCQAVVDLFLYLYQQTYRCHPTLQWFKPSSRKSPR